MCSLRSQLRMTNDELRIVIRVESGELRVEITIKVSFCLTFKLLKLKVESRKLKYLDGRFIFPLLIFF